ncbi:hypothetical protein [uncultured Corynebacterium sp.]|uniref:hypothetical protein n=1 Tax=uncultured Corynebacterium sp. TaxID=159447 RepID=UPI00259AF462|nr:hypothetical protein [uncultured Corynebacterium sp.]
MSIKQLPTVLRLGARRLRAVMVKDSGMFIILGVFFIARGIGYLAGDDGPGLPAQLLPVPASWWAVAWLAVGIFAVGVARRWQSRLAGVVLYLLFGMIGLWGAAFLLVSPAAFLDRGSAFLTIAALAFWAVWRGRKTEVSIRVNDREVADAIRSHTGR